MNLLCEYVISHPNSFILVTVLIWIIVGFIYNEDKKNNVFWSEKRIVRICSILLAGIIHAVLVTHYDEKCSHI